MRVPTDILIDLLIIGLQRHVHSYGLSTLETIVADFGNNLSPNSATVVANVDRALGNI